MISNQEIQHHLDGLAKPPRSLGRLEQLAFRLCAIQQTLDPKTKPRRLVLFAADHGVVAEGVTQWPSAVTGVIMKAVLDGHAASSVLARANETELRLIDVGSLASIEAENLSFRRAKVTLGTKNLYLEAAMSEAEFDATWQIGVEEAQLAIRDGCRLVMAGEMGIGNTTAASCVAMLLANVPLAEAVGRGAGADDATLTRKQLVVNEAVNRVRPLVSKNCKQVISAIAGFEIVAMAGFLAESRRLGLTVLLDGFVVSAAALIAERLSPGTVQNMIAAHRSAEPAHGHMLKFLELTPILDDWNMRLGEGTGALVALPLLDSAAAMCGEMARLSDLL